MRAVLGISSQRSPLIKQHIDSLVDLHLCMLIEMVWCLRDWWQR